ncbi:tyrosine-protein phosphatase [Streptomyces sp. BE230]|uniref:tyrosine-protein phosphatase n=1 Tax=Streptomyces sp. BE230 TaxID=3002526 RepID=UPI002ED4261A|nr:tyrosine-protein phosphatase [Streptomyces sp. BE230]
MNSSAKPPRRTIDSTDCRPRPARAPRIKSLHPADQPLRDGGASLNAKTYRQAGRFARDGTGRDGTGRDGKDRTGVVVALVQTLFGASEAEVVADFVRSNTELGPSVAQPTALGGHKTLPVAAGHLRRALLWIRSHHGSVPAYLQTQGATERDLSMLPDEGSAARPPASP